MLLAQSLRLDNLIFLPLQATSRFQLLLAAADLHLVVQRGSQEDPAAEPFNPNFILDLRADRFRHEKPAQDYKQRFLFQHD